MGIAGAIFKNTLWLTVGDKIGYALQFVFFLYFASKFGVVPAGEYSFAFFLTYAFACFADQGASLYLLREVGKGRPSNRCLFFDCFVLRALSLLAVFAIAGVVIATTQSGSSAQKLHLIACWGVYWIFYSLADLVLAELNGHGMSWSVALLGIWLRFLSTVAGIGLIYIGLNYDLVMIVFPVSGLIYLCTCLKVSASAIGPVHIRFARPAHYKSLLVTLTPFFFLSFSWSCFPARTYLFSGI
jgi:O-antigen/teichoic acid export membrane protein